MIIKIESNFYVGPVNIFPDFWHCDKKQSIKYLCLTQSIMIDTDHITIISSLNLDELLPFCVSQNV